jgi:hypothetical protein
LVPALDVSSERLDGTRAAVARAVSQGMRSKDIAAALGLTKSTVSYHVVRLGVEAPRGYQGRRAICGTLARSGIRASELCDLRVGEVRLHDPEGRTLPDPRRLRLSQHPRRADRAPTRGADRRRAGRARLATGQPAGPAAAAPYHAPHAGFGARRSPVGQAQLWRTPAKGSPAGQVVLGTRAPVRRPTSDRGGLQAPPPRLDAHRWASSATPCRSPAGRDSRPRLGRWQPMPPRLCPSALAQRAFPRSRRARAP